MEKIEIIETLITYHLRGEYVYSFDSKLHYAKLSVKDVAKFACGTFVGEEKKPSAEMQRAVDEELHGFADVYSFEIEGICVQIAIIIDVE